MFALLPTLLLLLTLSLPAIAGPGADGPAAEEGVGTTLQYQSVFDGYISYVHQPPAPWGQSNDRVKEVGGWRTYARESAENKDSGSQDAEPGTHSGHGHGGPP